MNYDHDITERDAFLLALLVIATVMGAVIGLLAGCRC